MTRGGQGHSTVFVDLKDKDGNPLLGATLTFNTSGATVTWLEGAVVESTVQPGTYYRTMVAPDTGAGTTVSVDVACGTVNDSLNQTVTVTYSEPHAGNGGAGGCSPADGNLRVKVIEEETGNPIASANVIIGLTEDTPFLSSVEDYLNGSAPSASNLATTDANGYAYFYDLGTVLDGNMTVTAGQPNGSATDRAYFTFDRIQASDLVVPLKLSRPMADNVRFDGGSVDTSSIDITDTDYYDLQGALVLPQINLDTLMAMDINALLSTNHCLGLPGMGEMAVPENLWVASQAVLVSTLIIPEFPWALTLPKNHRINLIYGSLDLQQLLAMCEYSEIIAALRLSPYSSFMGKEGFVPSSDTNADTTGYEVVMEAPFPVSLSITTANRPEKTDLLGVVLGDYAGFNGTGPSYINGLYITSYEDTDPNSVVVNYSATDLGNNVPANPDPGATRYYAAALAMYFDPITSREFADRPDLTAENGVSGVLWRDDGSGNAPLSGAASATWNNVNTFLAIAKLKTTSVNKHFVWDDVTANGTTPDLSVHAMYRLTETFRAAPLSCASEVDVVSREKDLYWEVWRPFYVDAANCTDTTGTESTPNPKECFTLPTLPSSWPRAGVDAATGKDDGFSTRSGSGLPCVGVSDCVISSDSCQYFGDRCTIQTHKSCSQDSDCNDCIASDTCTGDYTVCIGVNTDGDFILQYNEWALQVGYLGLASNFDFNRFSLSDWHSYVTHASANRVKLGQ
jgi:hypothetical protein